MAPSSPVADASPVASAAGSTARRAAIAARRAARSSACAACNAATASATANSVLGSRCGAPPINEPGADPLGADHRLAGWPAPAVRGGEIGAGDKAVRLDDQRDLGERRHRQRLRLARAQGGDGVVRDQHARGLGGRAVRREQAGDEIDTGELDGWRLQRPQIVRDGTVGADQPQLGRLWGRRDGERVAHRGCQSAGVSLSPTRRASSSATLPCQWPRSEPKWSRPMPVVSPPLPK